MDKNNLTRKEIAEALANQLGYSRSTCADIVDSFFANMKSALMNSEPIKIVHFGTFTLRDKNPRNGRNPRTGESILIKERQMVSFKPSKNYERGLTSSIPYHLQKEYPGDMKSQIPDKLYFKIGEVSKLAGVATHVIRYWESEFDQIRPKRANSNQRLYRRIDVELILVVKDLLHGRGYTIAGAKKLLADGANLNEVAKAATKDKGTPARLGEIKSELLQLYEILRKKPPSSNS